MRKEGPPERHQVGDEWLTVWEISQRCGHNPSTVAWRINHGWPIDEVMSRPVYGGWVSRNGKGLTYQGKPTKQKELAEMAGVSKAMISKRLKQGMTPEQAVAAGNYRTGNY